MKAFSLEKRHLRQAAVRKLAIRSWTGGFLTFLVGTWIVPWIGSVGLWLLHQLPWWHQAGSFPNLVSFVIAPNLLLGFIWLFYYFVAFHWAATTLSPRQKLELREQTYREYREKHGEWGFNMWITNGDTAGSYYQPPQPKEKEAPLSQAYPGELKHQLVEHCYKEYRKALQRYDPSPLDLKTPETFSYRKASQIEWIDGTLVIPEAVLAPERIHELLPFLAHYLYDYNEEKITVEDTHGFPDYVPFSRFLLITGNFLWLPVAYKHGTEEKVVRDSVVQQKQRVLDRDEFAVLLGQGPALEHILRRVEEDLKQRNEIDRSIPTLIERIGRLSVLNEKERQEMRALGLTPQEPPLVIDSPFRQIKQGKKRKQ